MCLYNLIRHTFTVAVLCVLTVVGALLGEWSNTIVLIVSILFLRAVRLIEEAYYIPAAIFQRSPRKNVESVFLATASIFLCGFLTFFHMRPPKFIVIYTVL